MNREHLTHRSPAWAPTRLSSLAQIRALLVDPDSNLEHLKISHLKIESVYGPLENQPGGESRVFRVRTEKGDRVLRIDFAQVLRDRAVAILLQRFLSSFDVVPKIDGIFEGAELKHLLHRHSAFAELKSPWADNPHAPAYSAILMEVVEDGWNLLQPERSRALPPGLSSWNRAKILGRVEEIGNLLTRLNIQVVDPQFLISNCGQVKLIDLDHWYFVDSGDEYYGYDGRAAIRLREWVPRFAIANDFSREVERALRKLMDVGFAEPCR